MQRFRRISRTPRDRQREKHRHRLPIANQLPGNLRQRGRQDPDHTPGRNPIARYQDVRETFSEMQSTGAISASDCLFRGSDRQLFIEKPHPDSGKRPFQPRIGDLNAFLGRKMTTFSNDTMADIRKYGLELRVTVHPTRRRSRDPARRSSGPAKKT